MLFTNFLFATPCYQSDPSYSTYACLKTQPALYLFCSTKKWKTLDLDLYTWKEQILSRWQKWEQKVSNSWWQVNPALNREGQAERTHCMQIKETPGVHNSFDVLPSGADQGSCAHKCVCYIFFTVARNAVNKSVWRKKGCSWLPLNKHATNIFI